MSRRIVNTELAAWRLRDLALTHADAGALMGASASTVSRLVNNQGAYEPEVLERFVAVVLRMPLALVTTEQAEPSQPAA